jgi:hypothetical protein
MRYELTDICAWFNVATDLPVGQISSLVAKSLVQPLKQKYFAFSEVQIRCMVRAIPPPSEGRIAIVTDVGSGMRWTHRLRETSVAGADG